MLSQYVMNLRTFTGSEYNGNNQYLPGITYSVANIAPGK